MCVKLAEQLNSRVFFSKERLQWVLPSARWPVNLRHEKKWPFPFRNSAVLIWSFLFMVGHKIIGWKWYFRCNAFGIWSHYIYWSIVRSLLVLIMIIPYVLMHVCEYCQVFRNLWTIGFAARWWDSNVIWVLISIWKIKSNQTSGSINVWLRRKRNINQTKTTR